MTTINRKYSDLKCLLGLHRYDILNKDKIINIRGEHCGDIYISRCIFCGKLKQFKIINKLDHE